MEKQWKFEVKCLFYVCEVTAEVKIGKHEIINK